MQGCKYNTREFAPFTSGKKRIQPTVTDDWEVFTGGFKSSTDVLNLRSAKLDQVIYDIGTDSFFKFMRTENVTMNGNKIVGRFVIGTQRVLRKESDYQATMSTIVERKSTLIEKKDMILGHRYETVCGSTFVFAGTRYFIKQVNNKSGVKLTKLKKYYLSYEKSNYRWVDNINDVTSKKVVKDHGKVHDKDFLDREIEKYVDKKDEILFASENRDNVPSFELHWDNTHEKLNDRYRSSVPDFLMHNDGYVYLRDKSKSDYYDQHFAMLESDDNITWKPGSQVLKYDTYKDNARLLADYRGVKPRWVKL